MGFVCVSLLLCVHAFVCARGTLCGFAVPSAKHLRTCLCVCLCVCVCVFGTTVRVCVGAVVARRGRAVLIARPAARAAARAWLRFGAIGRVDARLAAGVTWISRTTSAEWAARYGHTSVIDAAGAIYVIGGWSGAGGNRYNDVWASTDGGVRPDSVGGLVMGYTKGVLQGVLHG